MLSFTVTSGQKRWYVVGAYVPPNNLPAFHQIAHALTCGIYVVGKLLVGNLNAYLSHPRDQLEEYLVTFIAIHGLSDQAHNSMPRWRYRAEVNWMWRMWRWGGAISRRGGIHTR